MLFLLKLQTFRKNLLTPKWVTVREISGQNDPKNSSRVANIIIFKYLFKCVFLKKVFLLIFLNIKIKKKTNFLFEFMN